MAEVVGLGAWDEAEVVVVRADMEVCYVFSQPFILMIIKLGSNFLTNFADYSSCSHAVNC